MKKLLKISLALFVLASMTMTFVSCSDDDEDDVPTQNEVSMYIVTSSDTTVSVRCIYFPVKSVSYRLQLGNSVSQEYSSLKLLKIHNLMPGTDYTLWVMILDANHKVIGKSKLDFTTPNSTEGLLPTGQTTGTTPKEVYFTE